MIIGLSGFARSGKDEVAKILVEEYGFRRIAFADKIRDILYEMNPVIDSDYQLRALVDAYGWDEVKKRPQVREYLQRLGVAGRNHIDEGVWIKAVLSPYNSTGGKWMWNAVVTDVRFKNEAYYIKTLTGRGSELWRVNRPGIDAVNDHVSEHDLSDWNFDNVVNNEGSLDELKQLVRLKMSSLHAD